MEHSKPFVLVGALLLAACGAAEPEGARLRVAIVGDPAQTARLRQRLVVEATQPSLMARDGDGAIIAALATSWRYVDEGRSLIVRLRPAKWSDGTALGSNEVVAAFRRSAARREPALVHAGIKGIPGARANAASLTRLGVLAPISRVVELRFDAAAPDRLGWLAEPGLAITRAAKPPLVPASLGAYATSGTADDQLLKRRDMVAAPDRRPAEIRLTSSSDTTGVIAGFARGQNDIVLGAGIAGLGEARTIGNRETLRIDPLWGVYGYIANSRRGPLADAGVRAALAMAIDRAAITRSFGLGAIAAVEGLVPTSLAPAPVAEADGRWQALDLEARRAEARRLLAAAGWTRETPLRLVLLLPQGREHRLVAERIGAQWRELGVELAISESSEIDRLVARGNFDLAVSETSVPVRDAAALLARWQCAAGLHCDPVADALLDAARRAAPTARPALLAAAEARLMTAPPLIPLFTPVRWALVARQVDGWRPNAAGSHPLARLAATGRR